MSIYTPVIKGSVLLSVRSYVTWKVAKVRIVREKAHLKVIQTGDPIDVLWFRLSKLSNDPPQFVANIDSGKMLVMINRSDYWQCAFIVVKDGFENVKKRGMEEFRQSITQLVPFTKERVREFKNWEQVKLLSVSIDHLKKWYRPGVLCIGDAAHAMSPMGGVGINLAIQDAVAAANILVPAFERGIPTVEDLEKVQKRREFPTKVTQKFQTFLQDRVIIPYLRSQKPPRVPLPLKLFNFTILNSLQGVSPGME